MMDNQHQIGLYFIDLWKQKLSVSTDMEIEEENPTELNTLNIGGGFASVSHDKLTVKYNNVHCGGYDVGVVQANHPAPVKRFLYYFEMSVQNAGARGLVSIGFTTKDFTMCKQPGWEVNSYGYHGDDGLLYRGHGKGETFGPTYTAGDTVGSGINYATKELFFTKNGVVVGSVHKDVMSPLFPTVAVHSLNEEITVNFGKQPFVFDIKAFETQERAKQQMTVDKVYLEQDVSYGIVRSYLVHYGYEDTLSLLDLASVSSLPPIMSPPVSPIQRNGFNGDNEYALFQRRVLRQLIKNGDIDDAFRRLRDWYPTVFQDGSSIACFLLQCQKFIELVRVGKVSEAIINGRKTFDMQPKLPVNVDDLIKDCAALVAYIEPEKSVVGYLMKESHREFVADAINALILSTNPKVDGVQECLHSCLEGLMKQLAACYMERMALNENQGEAFNLTQLLDNYYKKG
ncbi:ran-binding protein M homolog isoform X2 [Impatiens glandulifera]|uniref:ran-binding protein M homolog isoform X2 n=1 Tax=Impatiens glandulifera TaxID=253017 RepID=UPI001FB17DEA|nr:ran-binding protein M homolog isoform X2 [Impatiens glandulifera]